MSIYTYTNNIFEMKIIKSYIDLEIITLKEENNAFGLIQEFFMKWLFISHIYRKKLYPFSAQPTAHDRSLPSFCHQNYGISLQLCLLWKLQTLHETYLSQGGEQSNMWFIGWLDSMQLFELVMWVYMCLLHLSLYRKLKSSRKVIWKRRRTWNKESKNNLGTVKMSCKSLGWGLPMPPGLHLWWWGCSAEEVRDTHHGDPRQSIAGPGVEDAEGGFGRIWGSCGPRCYPIPIREPTHKWLCVWAAIGPHALHRLSELYIYNYIYIYICCFIFILSGKHGF